MNQREIGNKIAELREKKGLSQEDLALKCGTKLRIIQKIETGDLSPRLLILKKIGAELDYDIPFIEDDDTKFWLLTLHLSNFLVIPIFPQILRLLKKDEIPEMNTHGKDVINFQISMLIYFVISIILALFSFGLILFVILSLYLTIITTINSANVLMERNYKYPLTIKFIKN